MSHSANGSPAPVTLHYQLIRKTTSPDEVETGVQSFVANLPASEILKLGTKENLRSYLAEDNPKKRNRVHEAIRGTIEKSPKRFITRNSGFVIAASDIDVDDNKKLARLRDPSIINGAQSQGEISRWVAEVYPDGVPKDEEVPFHVRVEIVVDPDIDEVVETAIARNTATPVKSISQAGARGQLDDLGASVKKVLPEIEIRMKETDLGDDFFDTRKILQYTRLLMPLSVSKNDSPAEKLRPYKNPEQCLTEFCDWYGRKDTDPVVRAKYDFTVQMAPYAIQEYDYWERHNGWNGQYVWEETKKGRACRRDRKTNRIVSVSPGLVFPILGALSMFVEQKDVKDDKGKAEKRWTIAKPAVFEADQMIQAAVEQFRGVGSDPMMMGRSVGVYNALSFFTRTVAKFVRDMKSH